MMRVEAKIARMAKLIDTNEVGRYGDTPPLRCAHPDRATDDNPIARAGPSASASCKEAETSPWRDFAATPSARSEEVE